MKCISLKKIQLLPVLFFQFTFFGLKVNALPDKHYQRKVAIPLISLTVGSAPIVEWSDQHQLGYEHKHEEER